VQKERSPKLIQSRMTAEGQEDLAQGLDKPVTWLRGVGPARANLLERIGLMNLRDLVFHIPHRLEPSGRALSLADACESSEKETVVFSGAVDKHRFNRFGRRCTLRLTVVAEGASLEVVYFNQPWQRTRFAKGSTYTFAGQVTRSSKGPLVVSPQSAEGTASLPTGSWSGVYGLTSGIGQDLLHSLILLAVEEVHGELEEHLETQALDRLSLPQLPDSVQELHNPSSPDAFHAARRRVLLETLLPLQARVLERSLSGPEAGGAVRVEPAAWNAHGLRESLPFELTSGQDQILEELKRDMARGAPMRRLLQGDVGSGKTVLALCACAAACEAGGQAAFMAPTELLAEQHYFGLRGLLRKGGLCTELLTGSMGSRARRDLLKRLKAGEIDVLFGTHALFSRDVHYARLALAIIDEQHRFGVAQRARLVQKGQEAHLLLMTATPIPRTLALTIYGDLDVSVLREKPAGRGLVRTRWLRPKDGERLPLFLRERLEAGEQVYWVCPLIGAEDVAGAEEALRRLRTSDLNEFGIELVHGRLAAEERAKRIAAFRSGDVRLLVATTVIEVGVDVPRATVMVIEEAERLGLAGLHQLRGRVGRSELDSWCLIFGKAIAKERFELLERCSDGFEIAEEDLARRGMGQLAGVRQSGEFGGLLSKLGGEIDLLTAARDLLQGDPSLRARLAAGWIASRSKRLI
jgi:ATP-dependent DNA helicase RecG